MWRKWHLTLAFVSKLSLHLFLCFVNNYAQTGSSSIWNLSEQDASNEVFLTYNFWKHKRTIDYQWSSMIDRLEQTDCDQWSMFPNITTHVGKLPLKKLLTKQSNCTYLPCLLCICMVDSVCQFVLKVDHGILRVTCSQLHKAVLPDEVATPT